MEGSSQVVMEPIFGRVTVDLSEFFQDFRKFCLVYLDYNKMKTVQDLKDYLLQTFKIRGNFVMMIEDVLLLEKDNLRVLRQGDNIWLTDPDKYSSPAVEVNAKRSKHTSQQTAVSGFEPINQNQQDMVQTKAISESSVNGLRNTKSKKRKNEEEANKLGIEEAENKLASDSIAVQKEKQHKQRKCHEPEKQECGSEIKIPLERHKKIPAVCNKSLLLNADISKNGGYERTNPTKREDNCFTNPSHSLMLLEPAVVVKAASDKILQEGIHSEEEEVSDWSSALLPKRKRIRKRRSRKAREAIEPNILQTPPAAQVALPTAPVPIRHHPGRTHIRFDGEAEQESVKVSNRVLGDEESAVVEPDLPTSSAMCAPNSQHHAKYKTETSNDLSQLLSRTKPIVFERNLCLNSKQPAPAEEQPRTSQPAANTVSHQLEYWAELSDEKLWNNPTLKEAPALNEIIAFKVLCLGPDYTPQLSPWLIATVVTEQHMQTDKLRLSILRGSNPLYRKNGKFEMEDTSEEQEEEVITIAWEDMVTPRIMSPMS